MDKEFKKDFWYPIPKFNIPKPEEFKEQPLKYTQEMVDSVNNALIPLSNLIFNLRVGNHFYAMDTETKQWLFPELEKLYRLKRLPQLKQIFECTKDKLSEPEPCMGRINKKKDSLHPENALFHDLDLLLHRVSIISLEMLALYEEVDEKYDQEEDCWDQEFQNPTRKPNSRFSPEFFSILTELMRRIANTQDFCGPIESWLYSIYKECTESEEALKKRRKDRRKCQRMRKEGRSKQVKNFIGVITTEILSDIEEYL